MKSQLDHDRIFLVRHESQNKWEVVNTPRVTFEEKAASTLLMNAANKYVEYENCLVLHRVIRRSSLPLYNLPIDSIGLSFAQIHFDHI